MPITLKNQTPEGEPLEAVFLPESGMNMISYRKGGLEVIDQSTKALFEERFAGLGALIGPHFHRRKTDTLPVIPDESLFPHIARVKQKGVADPFSHGIGRYAPWKYEATNHRISGVLTGKDTWNGVALSALEGQNFKMTFSAELHPTGLEIALSVVSDKDSLVGIHYYYHLPKGTGKIISQVQNYYLENGEKKPFPSHWNFSEQHVLTFDLNEAADYTFHPFPHPREGKILLDAIDYRLLTTFSCISQENCWQLYHPQGASYACIEPISSQDPRHPNLTVSSIRIHLRIEQ